MRGSLRRPRRQTQGSRNTGPGESPVLDALVAQAYDRSMMRRAFAGGGLAVVAGACWLLSSGAASARQAADAVMVHGFANGSTVQFVDRGTPIVRFSLFGGSNFHFTAISIALNNNQNASCTLTPSGGAACTLPTAVKGFVADTTISGQAPSRVSGAVEYGDHRSGRFTAPVTAASTPCRCRKLSAKFTLPKEEHHAGRFLFSLKWQLDCVPASGFPACNGEISVPHPHLPAGLELTRFAHKPWSGGTVYISCSFKGVTCQPRITGKEQFDLIGPAARRKGKTIRFLVHLGCGKSGSTKFTMERLTLKFDRHGNLDRHRSHFGRLS
jgi:hypothetical protein